MWGIWHEAIFAGATFTNIWPLVHHHHSGYPLCHPSSWCRVSKTNVTNVTAKKMRNVFVFRESQWLPVPKYKWMMYDCMRTWRSSLITISSATPHLPGYTWPSTLLCYTSLFSGCWNIEIIITNRSVQRSVQRLPSWTTGNTYPPAYRQKHNDTKHIETCSWFGLYLYIYSKR